MEEILQANIFFFIASIATVALSILAGIVLYRVMKITKTLEEISTRINEEAEFIVADVDEFRRAIKDKAGTISRLIGVFTAVRGAKRLLGGKKKK